METSIKDRLKRTPCVRVSYMLATWMLLGAVEYFQGDYTNSGGPQVCLAQSVTCIAISCPCSLLVLLFEKGADGLQRQSLHCECGRRHRLLERIL